MIWVSSLSRIDTRTTPRPVVIIAFTPDPRNVNNLKYYEQKWN